eukprot:Nitzschia sp. Nitz4//scaffold332_size19022//15494//18061//NITZ4_008743-RA/size19022-processed-gene-0.23-mRNA-1//-1//CDS//3329548210//8224//frame0
MDLLSELNIVTEAPAAKLQPPPKKRKKNNKYERRRQKAQKAKQQQNGGQPTMAPKVPSSPPSTKEPVPDDAPVTTESPSKPVPSLPEPSTATASTQQPQMSELLSKGPPSRVSPESHSNDGLAHSTTAATTTATSTTSHKKSVDAIAASNAGLSEQELAKYMAEFHARPMELDRRAGARSVTRISKASTHLFQSANDWDSLPIHPRLRNTLTSKFHLAQPTAIQSRTIQTVLDPSLQEKNVLVHAETGSGKTLAYLVPIIQQLALGVPLPPNARKELGTKCIILCPTRELASQTLDVVEKLCQANCAGKIVPGGLLGGDSRNSEKSRIRKGLTIVVATPGRMLDHLNKTESLLLHLKGKLDWLVLDEADRLLDMGLGDQVRQIVQLIRANEASTSQPWWRSVLVSATVTASVQTLAKERMLCGNKEWIWVKGGDAPAQAPKSKEECDNTDATELANAEGFSDSTPRQLAHFYVTVTAKLRLSTLISFLVQRIAKGERTVVFMATCASVDFHHQLFQSMEPLWDKPDDDTTTTEQRGLFGDRAKVFKLHGNVQHSQRNQTLKLFDKAKEAAILLTTDVSARGLNLGGVDWTVQYDPPCEIADYVHRAGRVARAGKAGHSFLFLLPSESGYLNVLQTKGIKTLVPSSLASTLNAAASECPAWTKLGQNHAGGKDRPDRRGDSRAGEHFAAQVQRRLEECIIEEDRATRPSNAANKKKRKQEKTGALLELAREAFMSFLRAYPTKREPAVRSIFSARALHLGHVARSFALQEPPKSLVSKHKRPTEEEKEDAAVRPKSLQFQEYENRLVTMDDDDDDDEVEERPTKQRRMTAREAQQNTRKLMLANAMKLQTQGMDSM